MRPVLESPLALRVDTGLVNDAWETGRRGRRTAMYELCHLAGQKPLRGVHLWAALQETG